MATGGGYSFKVCEAYGELSVKTARWDAGLRKAERGFLGTINRCQAAGQRMNSAFSGFGAAARPILRVNSFIGAMTANLKAANVQASKLNRLLRGMPTGPRRGPSAGSQIGSAARGIGAGLGSFARGAGAGLGHAAGGLGRGLGAGAAGFGRGLDSAMRGASGLARTFAAILARAAAGFGRLFATSIRGAGGAVGMLLAPIRSAVGSLGRLGSMGGIFGGLGGAVGVGFSVKEAADREQSYRTLGRIADVTGEAFGRLKGKMEATAASSTVHLADLRKMTEIGARQGIGGAGGMAGADALARFTKDMAKVKQSLPDLDIEDAANGIVRTLSVFKRGPRDILPFASALAAIDQASTATAGELLELTRRMSGVLGVLKATPAQALALAAAMRDAGIEVETGGTAVSTLLMRMAADSGKYSKAVGLDVRSLSRTIATDPVEAVRTWVEALAKFDPTQQIKILKDLHMTGRQSGQTILQLAAGYGKLGGFLGMAAGEWKSLDAVNRASNDNLQNTWGQLARVGNQFKLTGAAIGTHLLPVVKSAAGAMGEVLADIRVALERNEATFAGWAKDAAGSVRFLGVTWRSFPKFLRLGKVVGIEKLEQAAEVMKRFGSQVWANLSVGAANVPALLIDGFARAAPRVLGVMKELGKSLMDLMQQVFENIGAMLYNATAKQLPKFLGGGGPEIKVKPIQFKVPKVALDMADVKPLPGFDVNKLLGRLPNRAAEKAGIWGGIAADRRAADAEQGAARKAAAAEEAAGRAKDLDDEREEQRGRLEDMRRRVALMRTGRERLKALAVFRKQAADWGFKGPDLNVPNRTAALGAVNAAAAGRRRDALRARAGARHGGVDRVNTPLVLRDALKARAGARHRPPGGAVLPANPARPAPAPAAGPMADALKRMAEIRGGKPGARADLWLGNRALRDDGAARGGRLGGGMGKARGMADAIRRRRESRERNPVVRWGRGWDAVQRTDLSGAFKQAGRQVAGAMAPPDPGRQREQAKAIGLTIAQAIGVDPGAGKAIVALLSSIDGALRGGIGLQ